MNGRKSLTKKPIITNIIIIGDSLSDRRTLYNRKLFGFIPMSFISGLKGKSPDGSFTNGYTWSDEFISKLSSEFTIKKIKDENHLDATDIADAVINQDARIKFAVDHSYELKNSHLVNYSGQSFVRDYTEGGLSSHNYAWSPSINIKRFFSRIILSNLQIKRKDILQDDLNNGTTKKHKKQTLVIEWSGANDLITVNKRPTLSEADKAIKDRIKNMNLLINQGYRHFVLFNLPDLSLTPRYQALSSKERDQANRVSDYFNEKLQKACKKVQEKNKNCSITVFNVNKQFKHIYNHPEKYSLDKDKLQLPYVDSDDFKMLNNGTSPATGYMFWDNVHPTADTHSILGENFYEKFQKIFHFMPPTEEKHRKYSLNYSDNHQTKKNALGNHRFKLFSSSNQNKNDENRIMPVLRHSY